MKKYKHIFFDLDHTLWDFDKNSKETLQELFVEFKLNELRDIEFSHFYQKYYEVNDWLWSQYRSGRISKNELRSTRFKMALESFGVLNHKLAVELDAFYVKHGPHKTNLLPNSIKTLEYLKEHYLLHIITNGFSEVQSIKMEKTGIEKYFSSVFTSDDIGVNKPHPKIFSQALFQTKATRKNAIMIGDNLEADVKGAMGIGMDAIFFNPKKQPHLEKPTFEISDMEELITIL